MTDQPAPSKSTNEAPKSVDHPFNEPDDTTNPTVERPDWTKTPRAPVPMEKSPPVTPPAIEPAGMGEQPVSKDPPNPQYWNGRGGDAPKTGEQPEPLEKNPGTPAPEF